MSAGNMKPFLILQLRPEDIASDGEFEAFLKYGGLSENQVHRVRMEREHVPLGMLDNYSGVMVGGGPSNVSDSLEKKTDTEKRFEHELRELLKEIVAHDFPYFGMCYGFGFLVQNTGGLVSKEKFSEPVCAVDITLREEALDDPLTQGLPHTFKAVVGHKEACQRLPDGAVWLASSVTCPYQMIRLKQNVYGAQFHPELDAQGVALRIDVYKYAGYFPPGQAEELKVAFLKENIIIPTQILRRFVARYAVGM